MKTFHSLLLSCVLVSCGAPERLTNHSTEEGIPDSADTCPILVECFDGFEDYDGCPDLVVTFSTASTVVPVSSQKVLSELASEVRALKLARLRIVAGFEPPEETELAIARGQAVREVLVESGLPAETETEVVVEEGTTYVWFDPVGCATWEEGS